MSLRTQTVLMSGRTTTHKNSHHKLRYVIQSQPKQYRILPKYLTSIMRYLIGRA